MSASTAELADAMPRSYVVVAWHTFPNLYEHI